MKMFLERMKMLQGKRSQREFAEYLSIPLNSYTNWFLYDRNPSIDTLYSICTKLGESADWLLGLSDCRAPGGDAANAPRIADLEKQVHDLEVENAALQKALSLLGGGRHVSVPRNGGAAAIKSA